MRNIDGFVINSKILIEFRGFVGEEGALSLKISMYCWWWLRHGRAELIVLIHLWIQLTAVEKKSLLCVATFDILLSLNVQVYE